MDGNHSTTNKNIFTTNETAEADTNDKLEENKVKKAKPAKKKTNKINTPIEENNTKQKPWTPEPKENPEKTKKKMVPWSTLV